jgi:hypothetical protein
VKPCSSEQPLHELFVGDGALDEGGFSVHLVFEAATEIVQHHYAMAHGQQVLHHVCADEAGAAGNQGSRDGRHTFAAMAKPWLLPRWAITAIDLAMCTAALLAAYQLRFNFSVPAWEWELLRPMLPVYLAVRLGWHAGMGIQRGMVRHTGTEDARRVFLALLLGTATLFVANVVRKYLVDGRYVLPTSVLIIEFMGSVMLLISSRIAFKLLHLKRKGQGKEAATRSDVRRWRSGADHQAHLGARRQRALRRDGLRGRRPRRRWASAWKACAYIPRSELPDLSCGKRPANKSSSRSSGPTPSTADSVVDMAIAAQGRRADSAAGEGLDQTGN